MKAEPMMPKACSMPCRCSTFTKASSVVIRIAWLPLRRADRPPPPLSTALSARASQTTTLHDVCGRTSAGSTVPPGPGAGQRPPAERRFAPSPQAAADYSRADAGFGAAGAARQALRVPLRRRPPPLHSPPKTAGETAMNIQPPRANSLEAHWMPFTANRDFKAAPRLVTRSEGMYLWNQNGDRLIDGSSGLFNVAAGHGRREIADAVHAQMLAERLHRAVPARPARRLRARRPKLARAAARALQPRLLHQLRLRGRSTPR